MRKLMILLFIGLVAVMVSACKEGADACNQGGGGGEYGGAGGAGGAEDADPCGKAVISYFRLANFPFVTIVADDGQDSAGGWQQTSPWLTLADDVTTVYTCHVTIGMPLRATQYGKIPPDVAARWSRDVCNEAAAGLWPTPHPQGIFCERFVAQIALLFPKRVPDLGATVSK